MSKLSALMLSDCFSFDGYFKRLSHSTFLSAGCELWQLLFPHASNINTCQIRKEACVLLGQRRCEESGKKVNEPERMRETDKGRNKLGQCNTAIHLMMMMTMMMTRWWGWRWGWMMTVTLENWPVLTESFWLNGSRPLREDHWWFIPFFMTNHYCWTWTPSISILGCWGE